MINEFNELLPNMGDEQLEILLLNSYGVLNTRDLEAKIRQGTHTEMEFKLQVLANQKAIMLLLLQMSHPKLAAGVLNK